MQKFTFKLFISFVLGISLLFFSLIFFQKQTMQKEQAIFLNFQMKENPFNVPPMPPKDPPLIIPSFLIIFLSSFFLFLILKHLDKNFITPLISIIENVKKINEGNLNVKFECESKNKNIIETNIALNKMTKCLIEREKLMDNFIQSLSHDLRTPIIAQERALLILQDEFKNHKLVEGILQNSEDYLKMINLIIEAYDDREYKINKIKLNTEEIFDDVFRALKYLAQEKQIKIIKEIPKNCTVYVDYISIYRIFVNLISNSIENLDKNKIIKMNAYNDNEKTIITIEDNGSGIEKQDLAEIFNKYSKNKTGKKGVCGLGLNIVKDLVLKNNGTIKIESEKNLYTKFIMEFDKNENT